MRIVVLDSDASAAAELTESIRALVPDADVLVRADVPNAAAELAALAPDVVFVAPVVAGLEGPDVVAIVGTGLDATIVGVVAAPDAGWSSRYVDAGADVVAARPLDQLAIRTALRQRAGGVPGAGT